MSVIDLSTRTTDNWDEYQKEIGADESKVYVSGKRIFDNEGNQCLNFTVGTGYYSNGRTYPISKKGIVINPGQVLVIETAQTVAVPLNGFGLVFGVGINIFSGCIVSPGKIDPGFHGKLKIGFYNGNRKRIVLKPGDIIASASFWETEGALTHPLADYHDAIPVVQDPGLFRSVGLWIGQNWYSVLAIAIAIATLITTIIHK